MKQTANNTSALVLGLPEQSLNKLCHFGLTRQESLVFSALNARGPMNGYETAKFLNISRANAYSALGGLVEKGAAWMQEEDSVKYRSLPAEEFFNNRIAYLEQLKGELLDELPRNQPPTGSYLTIKGKQAVLDKLGNMLMQTEKRVYLALPAQLLTSYTQILSMLLLEDKKVVIITDLPRGELSPELAGATIYHSRIEADQIRVICDSGFVLTGQWEKPSSSSLFSDHPNLVQLFKESIKKEIRLIELDENKEK